MKCVEPQQLESLPGIPIGDNQTFEFRCHGELDCFNLCCRNLNLFLYPYDVLRLRRNLDVSADQFLETHTDMIMRPEGVFPDVLLRMADNEQKTCPFLTGQGCGVYADRPFSCRSFPMDQALEFNAQNGRGRFHHFLRPPQFCLGQHETTQWTLDLWWQDQRAAEHLKMTTRWAELQALFQRNPFGAEGFGGSRGKMALMATYNMDQFRLFVFGSSFLKRYRLKPAVVKKLRRSDKALLSFGMEWVKFFLWGIPTKTLRMR